MCARFDSPKVIRFLTQRFGLNTIPPQANDGKERRPTDEVLAITGSSSTNVLRWGFEVDWSKKPIINARSETLFEKTTFQPTRNQRCLIPASAWYEWRKDGSNKIKTRISLMDEEGVALAAIHDGERFCILTCAPHPQIAHIHSRMPVMISPDNDSQWLDSAVQTDALQHLLDSPKDAAFAIAEEKPVIQQMSLF